MTYTTYWFSKKLLMVGVQVALVGMSAPIAYAAFTENFDVLKTELQARSLALAGSLDKAEQKQKKAADKVIATIDKAATTIGADVKTAGKVAKSLTKAFPSEFSTSLVFSNDLSVMVDGLFDGLEVDITADFTALETALNALEEGKTKDKVTAAVLAAQAALDVAGVESDFATLSKALGSALKAIASGQKAVDSGGGGGGGCSASTFTMTVSNEVPLWIATTPSASFTPSTGDFTVGGQRGTDPFDVVAIGLFPVNGFGNYPIGATSVGGTTTYVSGVLTTNMILYELISGDIYIGAINAGPVGAINGTASGTFTFTAADSDNAANVITIDGAFNICDMVTLPPPIP